MDVSLAHLGELFADTSLGRKRLNSIDLKLCSLCSIRAAIPRQKDLRDLNSVHMARSNPGHH